jgi:hypothetical protein
MKQSDYRTGHFADDLVDQVKRMLRTRPEAHERDIWPLPGRCRSHLVDADLSRMISWPRATTIGT